MGGIDSAGLLKRGDLVAEEAPVLRAVRASPPAPGCQACSGLGRAQRGPAGNPGSDDKAAGSPQEEPHLSFHQKAPDKLRGFISFWVNKSIFNKILSF